MNNFTGLQRLSLLLTLMWILTVAGIFSIEETLKLGHFILISLLPPLLLWGIYWVIKGFKVTAEKTNTELYNYEIIELTDKPRDFERRNINLGYSPWRRYLARYVDVFFGSTFLIFVALLLYPPIRFADQTIVALFAGFIFVVLIEPILVSTFRNTPGKVIFGLKVVNKDGSTPSFYQAIKRNFEVYFLGLGAGIPFFLVPLSLVAKARLEKSGSTLWDEHQGLKVTAVRLSAPRKISALLVIIGVCATMYGLFFFEGNVKSSGNIKNQHSDLWANPMNGQTTYLPSDWRTDGNFKREKDSIVMAAFYNIEASMHVQLIYEKLDTSQVSSENYINALYTAKQNALQKNNITLSQPVSLPYSFRVERLFSFYSNTYRMGVDLGAMSFFVWVGKSGFWHVVVVSAKGKPATIEDINSLLISFIKTTNPA